MAQIKVSKIETIAINVFTPIALLLGGPTMRYGPPDEITRRTKFLYLKYLRNIQTDSEPSQEEKDYLHYTPCGLMAVVTAKIRNKFSNSISQNN